MVDGDDGLGMWVGNVPVCWLGRGSRGWYFWIACLSEIWSLLVIGMLSYDVLFLP